MFARVGICALLLLAGCRANGFGRAGAVADRAGDEIMVCGQLIHTGAPVVLWFDAGGYDAYRAHRHFDPDKAAPSNPIGDAPVRFGSWRRHVSADVSDRIRRDGWTLDELRDWVDLFVIHYDVCGTSQRCFKVLHDVRGLSVHFMLDVDGTIYQTLDVKERAWHAGSANDRSVGIEIANIGAYPIDDTSVLDKWYGTDATGRRVITFPDSVQPTGVRDEAYVARPSRPDPVVGTVQNRELAQYDLTDAQYDSLIRLTATLSRVLPRIELRSPRDADGAVVSELLSKSALEEFRGVLGHFHVSGNKTDPGPAFDWDRVLDGARAVR